MIQNKEIKLLLLLVTLWTAGLFITLTGGSFLIALASYFLVGDFYFDRSILIRGSEISLGCGFIIGVGQCLMSIVKPSSSPHSS